MEKNLSTKASRYGDAHYNNREKLREACLERYGVNNPFLIKEVQREYIKKRQSDLGYPDEFIYFINNKEAFADFLSGKNYTYFELAQYFNIKRHAVQYWVNRLGLNDYIDTSLWGKSWVETEVYDYIVSLGVDNIERNNRKVLSPHEIDIYLPDLNLGIEFNGTYWHSNLFMKRGYHQQKSKEAEEKGIRLIHIYEYEWDDENKQRKIKELLKIACNKVENRIYARNCEIRQISNKEAKPFNDANHLQGHRNAQVTYGLFYLGELVQLMSFSKTRYNRNLKSENSWEIIRGCPGSNNIVVGGVSKLFKHFVDEYDPDSVFSYCDFNKFDGSGYEALGMKFVGYSSPDIKYVIGGNVVDRDPKHYKENKENCDYIIYGAGSKKYCIVFKEQ